MALKTNVSSIEDQILERWSQLREKTGGESTLMDATIAWLEDNELESEEIVPHISASFINALSREALALNLLKERRVVTGNVELDI